LPRVGGCCFIKQNERKKRRELVASILNGWLGEKHWQTFYSHSAVKCYGGADFASFLALFLARSKLKYHMGEFVLAGP